MQSETDRNYLFPAGSMPRDFKTRVLLFQGVIAMQRSTMNSSQVRPGKERTLPIDKDIFADRLWSAIKRSGLTYKETARRAQEHLPPGVRISDVSVWSYAKGRSLPRRITHVEALGKVLGIATQELIGDNAAEESAGEDEGAVHADRPVAIEDLGNGEAFLRVNQALPWPVAVEILRLIKGEHDHHDDVSAFVPVAAKGPESH